MPQAAFRRPFAFRFHRDFARVCRAQFLGGSSPLECPVSPQTSHRQAVNPLAWLPGNRRQLQSWGSCGCGSRSPGITRRGGGLGRRRTHGDGFVVARHLRRITKTNRARRPAPSRAASHGTLGWPKSGERGGARSIVRVPQGVLSPILTHIDVPDSPSGFPQSHSTLAAQRCVLSPRGGRAGWWCAAPRPPTARHTPDQAPESKGPARMAPAPDLSP
jgi:hypothetical protein